MRRGRDNGFLKNEDGRVIAINLGADYCAEHEFGIKELRSAFGINDDPTLFGIQRRVVTKIPAKDYHGNDTLQYLEFGTKKEPQAVLVFGQHLSHVIEQLKGAGRFQDQAPECAIPKYDKDATLGTAWSERDFGIHVKGAYGVEQLKAVYEAFLKNDIAIWVGGGQVFQNGGLILGIVSRLPADKLETMRAADEDRAKLNQVALDTGITAVLNEAGKRYYALSPRWKSRMNIERASAYSVVFWLNPVEQQQNNAGYFTVEELQQWAKGEGPVPMKQGAKK